ncbi:PAS domain-containing protein [Microcoleus sp. LEGE 07076]|uniref:PAS domain-containing protein n=1 Tax=Microcoleus sp. LEGE 07076 TaxID=915322 RepID=UPI001880798B|nr:PAS domain-containing protein [Microcoleus sp. LEGE 07076]MBE9183797.1 PAS domain-containing protein [Microcoleus sp. LEGE 07076]
MKESDKKYAKVQTLTPEIGSLKQNILIVDDNPESLRLLSQFLSKRGYKARPTRDGQLALNFARSNRPDLILLDIIMPGMDGYKVCEQLKACPETKDIPVIFISCLNEVIDKVKAFGLGAVDYITKPFEIEEVVARVENQLLLSRLSQQIIAQNARLQAEIEERQRLEAQLRESQQWLSAIIKMNPNLLYVYDLLEQRILYLNREVYADLGYSLPEIQQMPAAFFPNLIHPDDLPAFSEHMSRIERSKDGETFEFEYRIQHKNGEYRWFFSLDTVFVRTAEGKPWKFLGTATEISDRKQAELELKTALAALERQIKQRFLLETITLEIRYSLKQERVFQTAAAQICRVFNADTCLIHTYTEDPLPQLSCVAKYTKSESQSLLDVEIPVDGNSHVQFVLSQDRVVVCDDVFADPLLENIRDLCQGIGLKSMIAVRTSYQGKANGMMCLHQYDRRNWTQDEIGLLKTVAAQMGIAIAQANLLEQDKQQRLKLQQSEASLAAAQKIAHIGSWEFDVITNKITWSEEVFRIFGLDSSAPEPTYVKFLQMCHRDDRDFFQETVSFAISQGISYKKELRILHPSGQIRHVEARGTCVFSEETPEVIKLLGTVMDITDRKQAEAALQISEERFYMAFEGSAMGLWDWNIAREEVYFNSRWKTMLGYEVEEIENSFASWERLVHPEDLSSAIAAINAHWEGKDTTYEVEFRMLAKSGEWKWILAQGKVMERDAWGNPLRMTGTHIDISDRKQAEVDLQFSEQREREKAQQLAQTLEHLKNAQSHLVQTEKMSSIGQMVAGVAHEINNPISFIYGNIVPAAQYAGDLIKLLQIYQQHYPEPVPEIAEKLAEVDVYFIAEDFPKIMASMKGGANRIKQIVLSLRNFSRLDEKDIKLTDIHEGIESTLVLLQQRLQSQPKGGEIKIIKNYGELPKIECYPAQLNQVFMNLLLNAIDACEESLVISHQSLANNIPTVTNDSRQMFEKHLQIQISTEINGDNLVIVRIADNGAGIPPEVQSRMFDPFFTTKPIGSGTGLGLSISYQIVKDSHGGKLSCCSEVGRGTEFAIELPILQKLKINS